MSKIGIFGGTFNPVHIGHMIMAENFYEQLNLDEVWMMPSGNPPHKDCGIILDGNVRCEMIRRAIGDNKHIKCSDFELKRDGVIYTADTLQLLKEKYSSDKLYFLIGEDSLDSFETWYHPERIVSQSDIVVAVRSNGTGIDEKIKAFTKTFKCPLSVLRIPYIGVSSSDIRERIRKDNTIKYMINENVEKFIYENNLYKG